MAKILIVDDSDFFREQIKAELISASHTVIEAMNGLKGLEQLKNNPDIELIFCDLHMPEMDGLMMSSSVLSNPTLKKIPIFILTTESGPELKAKGKALGIQGWIFKPLEPGSIVKIVDKISKTKPKP